MTGEIHPRAVSCFVLIPSLHDGQFCGNVFQNVCVGEIVNRQGNHINSHIQQQKKSRCRSRCPVSDVVLDLFTSRHVLRAESHHQGNEDTCFAFIPYSKERSIY
uniref:Uncharacterized protein n=1 Tax=Cacopsylla melanoneura TaxID=428564 RepID=A0A8D8ZBZ6_9HEMI